MLLSMCRQILKYYHNTGHYNNCRILYKLDHNNLVVYYSQMISLIISMLCYCKIIWCVSVTHLIYAFRYHISTDCKAWMSLSFLCALTGSWGAEYSSQDWAREDWFRGPTSPTSHHHRIRHSTHTITLLHIWWGLWVKYILVCLYCMYN
jgi:hypothetical protein